MALGLTQPRLALKVLTNARHCEPPAPRLVVKKAYGGVVIDPAGKVLLREPTDHYKGPETRIEVEGERADAVLGRFGKNTHRFIAVLEGKGTRDPLDRPFSGPPMFAVDQAYRYAINLSF